MLVPFEMLLFFKGCVQVTLSVKVFKRGHRRVFEAHPQTALVTSFGLQPTRGYVHAAAVWMLPWVIFKVRLSAHQ